MLFLQRGATYSLDESRRDSWTEKLATHVNKLQTGRGQSMQKYAYRYMGSTVGDVHRTLVITFLSALGIISHLRIPCDLCLPSSDRIISLLLGM